MPKFTVNLNGQEIELPLAETRDKALVRAGLNPIFWQEEDKPVTERRSKAIPDGVRLAEEVPDEECHKCDLAPTDHTVNFSFPITENGSTGYQKVCLKDWAKHIKKEKELKTKTLVGNQLAFETVIKLDIRNIKANPYQPEGRIEPPQDVVERIAASIKEHGLLQTPVVRQRPDGAYEMGDGWIRLKGYELLAKESSDWYFLPVVIRNLTDQQMADLVMEANTVRNDLSPIDLAKFYKKYLEDFKITQAELARLHNVSQGEIANTLRLLDLPEDIQKQVISQEISETHARYLLQVKDPKEMNKLAKSVVDNKISVVQLDREIKTKIWSSTVALYEEYGNGLAFDVKGCDGCEHKLMVKYPYGAEKDPAKPRCDNKKCWTEKNNASQQASHQKEVDDLKAEGITNFLGDWVATNDVGIIIAVGSSKESADRQAKDSYVPIPTVINPWYSDYMLNHTYRILFATNKNLDGDVTAENVNTAIVALGGTPDDVEAIKVHKCSGKPSTGGGVGCGWGKCTETIDKSGDDEFCGDDGDD